MGVPIAPCHWIAMETFDMINSFQQKRAMLVSAATRRFSDKVTLDDFKKCLKTLQETGDLRTVAAHGRWGVSSSILTGLVWMRNAGDIAGAMVYEPRDFEGDLSRISDAAGKLSAFFQATMFPRLEADAKMLVSHIKATENIKDAIQGP